MKTLERVARALATSNGHRAPDAYKAWLKDARAALIALFDPSVEIAKANLVWGIAQEVADGDLDYEGKSGKIMACLHIFQAMIQQALQEGEEG